MKLRKIVSESLEKIFASNVKEATSQILQERELRKVLVGVIAEAGAEVVPHRSTGINVLEDLLKKIIPTIEQDYKKLTTSAEQRDAFKSHIVNAIQNSLAPLRAAEEAGEPVMDIDEDINVDLAAADDLGMEMPDELDAANIDADEEKFIDIDSDGVPDDVDSDIDAPQITDQEVQDTFLETHDEIINQFMTQDFGEVDRAVRNAGFLDVQDNIRANFELFDPRYAGNSPMTVNQRIRDFIGEAMRSRLQAADTDKVVNQTVDPRFDFEAVPLNPQEDIYSSEYKDFETGEPRRVTNAFGPVTASIASAETGIDPMFLSTSTLVPFLTNLPQVMSAEQAMNTIGIKEEGNWFKPSKSLKPS